MLNVIAVLSHFPTSPAPREPPPRESQTPVPGISGSRHGSQGLQGAFQTPEVLPKRNGWLPRADEEEKSTVEEEEEKEEEEEAEEEVYSKLTQ